ncbi:hypothetical protein ACFQY3_23520 [Paenibacillus farraposensis]|uniref:hypothetical protein n=1 Tax=Paenibacillus farraposensis TaxID=2807095 RepID=UPI00361326A0
MKFLLNEVRKQEGRKIVKPFVLTMLSLFVLLSPWSIAWLTQGIASAAFSGGIPKNFIHRQTGVDQSGYQRIAKHQEQNHHLHMKQ